MSQLNIYTEPNPFLHQKCQKVTKFDAELKKLAQDMIETLFSNDGIGLAAPQIGKTIRLIVVEYNPERFTGKNSYSKKLMEGKEAKKLKKIPLTVLVNPKITNCSLETEIADEGCLSLPNIEIPIKRSLKINVLAQDLDGNRLKIRTRDLFARILQHEIDHLDGILITDKTKK